jgi:hypothetical protein
LVIVDTNKNIQRIVDRAKSYLPLYDAGVTPGKLRDVFFGDPENNDAMSVPQMPYLYVTTRPSRQNTRRDKGILSSQNARQLTVEYELVIISKSNAKSVEAQKQMNDIIKNLTTLIEIDPLFTSPITGLDPIFSRSVISDIPNDEATRGQLINRTSIILLATIGTSFALDIAGFTDIPLISKPIEREIENTENIFDTARIRKNTAPISETHSLFAEMEYDETLITAIRTAKRERTTIPITLKRPSSSSLFNGRIVEISNGAQFDQIETFTIRFEVIH